MDDIKCKILDYEDNWWRRGIKEAIHIKQHEPTLNDDGGRFHLHPVWDLVLKDDSTILIGGEETPGRKAGDLFTFTTEEG